MQELSHVVQDLLAGLGKMLVNGSGNRRLPPTPFISMFLVEGCGKEQISIQASARQCKSKV